jgi:hypothetical protein
MHGSAWRGDGEALLISLANVLGSAGIPAVLQTETKLFHAGNSTVTPAI